MQIAIDVRMLGHSGIGTYIRNIIPLCIKMMPDYDFLLIGGKKDKQKLCEAPNVSHKYVNAGIYSLKEQLALPGAVHQADALWVPHYNIPLFTRIPLIVTVHDLAHLTLPEITGNKVKLLYAKTMLQAVKRKARLILTVSDFSRNEFINKAGLPKGRLNVVYNGVDESWFNLSPQASPFPYPYFTAIGNVKNHKRIKMLCRAFAQVAEKIPQHLLVIGKNSGFLSGGESIEALKGLQPDKIHFTGELDFSGLQNYMANSCGLIFPSAYEGFGLPPLEALAAGVPVLASDIAVMQELYKDNIKFFACDNRQSLARAIIDFSKLSDEERKTIKNAGIGKAKQFSWRQAACLTVAAIRQCFPLQNINR